MRILLFLGSVLLIASAGCGGEAKSAVAVPQNRPLSSDEFVGEFCRRVSDIDPTVTASPCGGCQAALRYGPGGERTVPLDEAYREYTVATENIALILARVVDANLAAIRQAREAQIDTSQVLPVVTSAQRLAELQPNSPVPGEGSLEAGLYHEPLNKQLIVLYELDNKGGRRYLSQADVASLGLPAEKLRRVAMENLHRLLPETKQYGDRQVSIVAAGGRYEASLLLFDSLWTKDFFAVGGEIVVAVPSREVLLVTGSEDFDGLKRISSLAREAFAQGAEPIARNLFIRRGGEWQVFAP